MVVWGDVTRNELQGYSPYGEDDDTGVLKCWEQLEIQMEVEYRRTLLGAEEYRVKGAKVWKHCKCQENNPGQSIPAFIPPFPGPALGIGGTVKYSGDLLLGAQPVCLPCNNVWPPITGCPCPNPLPPKSYDKYTKKWTTWAGTPNYISDINHKWFLAGLYGQRDIQKCTQPAGGI